MRRERNPPASWSLPPQARTSGDGWIAVPGPRGRARTFTRVHASPSPVSLPPSSPQFSAHLPARLISQSTSGIQNLFSKPVSLQIYLSIPEVSVFSTLVGGTAFASLWVVVVCCSVTHSCPTLCDPMDCSPSRFSVHGILSPGKNTGLGCHAVLQGVFSTQGSNLHLLCLLHCRQILPLSHQGSLHFG